MLQNLILNKLIDNLMSSDAIQNIDNVTQSGKYALDATEKNPNIQGTLAESIANVYNKVMTVSSTVNSIVELPEGNYTESDIEIAAAKVGSKGETYSTLQNSIIGQIEAAKQVSVSKTKPDENKKIDVWVDSSENLESTTIPEIDDTSVNRFDTWSSYKVNKEFKNVAKFLPFGDNVDINDFNIADMFDDEDDEGSILTGWSSQKISHELKNISETVFSGVNDILSGVTENADRMQNEINGLNVRKINKTDIANWAKASTKPIYLANEIGLTDGRNVEDAINTLNDTISEKIAAIVSDAPEKYDTLKEIAAWIESDTDGAAKMQKDIRSLDTNKLNKSEISTWAKASTKPTYLANEIKMTNGTTLENAVSALESNKLDKTAISNWAKASTKPTYSASEIYLSSGTSVESSVNSLNLNKLNSSAIANWAKASTKPTYSASEIRMNNGATLESAVSAINTKLAITTGTLSAGGTSITLYNNNITTSSVLSFYTSIYGVNPKSVSVSAGSVTLTFKAQTSNMVVGVSVDG